MDIWEVIGIIVAGCIMLIPFIYTIHNDKKARERARERAKKEVEEYNNRYDIAKEEYDKKIESLIYLYGDITAKIPLWNYHYEGINALYIENQILVFEGSEKLIIYNHELPFKKILATSLTDNPRTISTTTGDAVTKTSSGSMIGRGLAGGALLGGVGALAGAATAKKNTEIQTTTTTDIEHNYILFLSVDDLINPTIKLDFGKDADSAHKANAIFNAIINRNNQ